MTKGDIVLVSFPFTNYQGTKRRPAVVFFSTEEDVTVCFITSKIFQERETDLLVKPDKENNLKKQSLIRINKIATLEIVLVRGKIGRLAQSDILKMNQKISQLFLLE